VYRMEPLYSEEGGKKSKSKSKSKYTQKNREKVVVGLVYANWCGHCQALKPEWARMKKIVPIHRVSFVEINEQKKDAHIENLNRVHNVALPSPDGYPTIFRFGPDKQIEYYNGERMAHPLAKWALNGGSAEGGSKKKHRNRTAKKRRGTRKRGFFDWLKW